MADKMKKNYIVLNWAWRCVVLMLAAVFSAAAQGRTSIKMVEEPLFKADSIEVGRKEQIAEVIPSINLVGISASKKSLVLGGLANIVREKAYGLQIGGLYNHFGMGGGLAVGGLLNTTSASYYGIQVGGLANIVREKAYGLQIGGLCNHAGMGGGLAVGGLLNTTGASYHGVQVGGLANIVREKAYGLQIGGLYNHFGMGGGLAVGGLLNTTGGSYHGVQVGGLGNISKDVAGLQVGGLFNATKNFYGLQIAGVMNVAQDSYGLQLAGVTNVAKDVYGLQFAGVVNIAKEVKGVQFASILNVAEESDFPIGLVNIIKNGDMGVALTYDILGNSMVSFRSGGRYAYGILGVGYNQCLTEKIVAEAGYGIRLPLCRGLQINNELKATAPINTSSVNFSYLLAPSVTLWRHLNFFGGPSFNFLMSDTAEMSNLLPKHALWRKESSEGVRRLYVGYQAGVQYIF